eukprot:4466095-Prymnesium_polylepis.1
MQPQLGAAMGRVVHACARARLGGIGEEATHERAPHGVSARRAAELRVPGGIRLGDAKSAE